MVLDTNVVLSALLFAHGRLSWMRSAWQGGRFLPLGSRETLDELLRVLGYPKFGLNAEEIVAILGDYVPWIEVAKVTRGASRTLESPDPDDQKFLDLAMSAEARYVVTGDAGVLGIRHSGQPEIVTPEAFRRAVQG